MVTVAEQFKKNVVWDVNDKYGKARAIRIQTPDGIDTSFSMVYGKNEKGQWEPVRPVSDRFSPISTEVIIDKVIERLGGKKEIFSEQVSLGRGGVTQQVQLVLNSGAIKIGDTKEEKDSPMISEGIIERNGDIWRPTVRVRNALDGTRAINVMAGWFRLVCSNGMIAEAWDGASSRTVKIHTEKQIEKALDEIEHFDFNYKEFQKVLKKLNTIPIANAEFKRIQKQLPKNYMQGLEMIPERTAYGIINYVTYIQSHHMSINRSDIVQPIINTMLKKAA